MGVARVTGLVLECRLRAVINDVFLFSKYRKEFTRKDVFSLSVMVNEDSRRVLKGVKWELGTAYLLRK